MIESIGIFKDKYFKELQIKSIGTVFKNSNPVYYIEFLDKVKNVIYCNSIEEFNSNIISMCRKIKINQLL